MSKNIKCKICNKILSPCNCSVSWRQIVCCHEHYIEWIRICDMFANIQETVVNGMSYEIRAYSKEKKSVIDIVEYKLKENDLIMTSNLGLNINLDDTEYIVVKTETFKKILNELGSSRVIEKEKKTIKKATKINEVNNIVGESNEI